MNFKWEEARPAEFVSRLSSSLEVLAPLHAAGQECGKERLFCFFCGRQVLVNERQANTTSEKQPEGSCVNAQRTAGKKLKSSVKFVL